jgi:hypothetical protein
MLSLFSALRSGAGLFVWRASRLVPLKREPGATLRQARRRRGWSGRFSWCECSGGQLRECQRISCPRLALGGDRDRFTGASRVRRPRGTGRAPNLSARSRSLSHDWVGFGFELRGADFLWPFKQPDPNRVWLPVRGLPEIPQTFLATTAKDRRAVESYLPIVSRYPTVRPEPRADGEAIDH